MKLRILAVTFAALVVAMSAALIAGAARDTATTVAPVEMNYACALKSNGLMSYVTSHNDLYRPIRAEFATRGQGFKSPWLHLAEPVGP